MTKTSNKEIISKYLDSEATEIETMQLMKWLEKKRNQIVFKDYIKAKLLIDFKFKSFDSEESMVLFLDEIKLINKNKNNNRFKQWLKFAAIFVGICLLATYTIYRSDPGNSLITISEITLEIDEDNVEVIQIDGRKIITSQNGKEIGTIEKGILTYKNSAVNKKKLAYNNILTVPYGKQFDVILADGTSIHMNAGSIIKYPSNFDGNSKREVFLEGEAYFKVAKDINIPFIVKTERLDTRVYGTEFNVSAYENDTQTEVVLVEGIVGIKEVIRETKLPLGYKMIKPSQKATIEKSLNGIIIENVDVKPYIQWKSGVLMFNDENMSNIFKKLERHFNVEIQNNYINLYSHSYTGVFKSENIDEILNTISAHTKFSYSRKGKIITINNH